MQTQQHDAQEPEQPPVATSRRLALWQIGAGALALLAGQSAWATWRFAQAPVAYGPSQQRLLGEVQRFPRGQVVYDPGAGVFVLHDIGGLRALSATCTHLGCTVRQDAATGGFVCPCHGSRFGPEGEVTGGPAAAPLAFLELRRDRRGRLTVDLARRLDAARRLRLA